MATVLYSDKLVEMTEDGIRFRAYYFPAGSKNVAWPDIERVIAQRPSVWTGSWRLWGTASPRYWFTLDLRRPSRDRIFLLVRRNTWMRIGFTVEDSALVSAILRDRGLLDENDLR